MQRSRKWWREHYDNYLLSKLSIAAYSSNNNIKKSTFYSWIKKFRSENIEYESTCGKKENVIGEPKSSKIEWAAIEAIATHEEPAHENVTLKITIGKAKVEINKDINPQLFSMAVKVLMENV